MSSNGFLQIAEIKQNVDRRIEELTILQKRIDTAPRGELGELWERLAPEFKAEYLEIATYMQSHEWFRI